MHLRFVIGILVLGQMLAAQVSLAQEPNYSTIEQMFADAVSAPCNDADRMAEVVEVFKRAGAAATDIHIDEYKDVKNVVVKVSGTAPGFIVIGAHFDKVEAGCGALDNWTGVTILAHLYKTVRQLEPARTLLFVGLGREEAGLLGSKAMVRAIPKNERKSYCGMINLDSFGLARPQFLLNVSTNSLVKFTRELAKKLNIPTAEARVDVADADSSSFANNGIPAITLHGLSAEWIEIIHSPNDRAERIIKESVYDGYILALHLLGQMDSGACDQFR